jgi:hypothetical protein
MGIEDGPLKHKDRVIDRIKKSLNLLNLEWKMVL